MALVWRKATRGKTYEVRQAGNSLRLYTDGTFHSQYNSKSSLSGGIWDLLVLPALFFPQQIKRVLVLGVGGGAVIRQLEHLLDPDKIVGVELDPVHIAIAKKHFGLSGKKRVSLIRADAIEWLRQYRGKPFDLIIDDLFVENSGDPHRAVVVNGEWSRVLLKNIAKGGGLAINFESSKALRSSALISEAAINRKLSCGFALSVPNYDNRIGAFFKQTVFKSDLSESLLNLEHRLGKSVTRRLAEKVRKLF
ncbi:MAG: methyltransferase domain-containing protein [Cellvibrionaceae bacterium]